ncbi:hypothetical protein M514_05053 [Trichuris suis]|uniref:Uncharacterized protein n=1 Tax=Trichuris suis TaxID=68888 RepID=A0A085NCU4_9BILA|nr:hypothetical protein M514_05053 [Trichuris suis]
MPLSSFQEPSGTVATNNTSGGMQKFIKDWMQSNGVMYQCSRCYVPIRRVFKCRISVEHFDIVVSAISANWKMAKKIASYRVCARLLALNALTFDELPSRFHSVCRTVMLQYSKRLHNGRSCSSSKAGCASTKLIKAVHERPHTSSYAQNASMSKDSSVIDLTKETSQEVIDLTEDDFDNVKSGLPPWILGSPYLSKQYPVPQTSTGFTRSALQNLLAMEIIAFYEQSIQPRHKLIEKLRAVQRLEKYIWTQRSIRASICIVGSSVNGLGSRNCDVDLCLVDDSSMPDEVGDRDSALRTLRKIQRHLQKRASPVSKAQLIPARVPIIRCKFRSPWNYSVDINWNNVHGIYNTHLLHHYSQADERFPMLYVVIHNWACQTGICDSLNGYLSSYSWALLLIHFLQCGTEPPVLPCLQLMFPDRFSFTRRLENLTFFKRLPSITKSSNRQHVGELLTSFFYYYGGFDFSRFMISVRLGTLLPRIEFAAPICIEEPYDRMNTARSLSHEIRFLVFRDYIRKAYYNLQTNQSLSSMYYVF